MWKLLAALFGAPPPTLPRATPATVEDIGDGTFYVRDGQGYTRRSWRDGATLNAGPDRRHGFTPMGEAWSQDLQTDHGVWTIGARWNLHYRPRRGPAVDLALEPEAEPFGNGVVFDDDLLVDTSTGLRWFGPDGSLRLHLPAGGQAVASAMGPVVRSGGLLLAYDPDGRLRCAVPSLDPLGLVGSRKSRFVVEADEARLLLYDVERCSLLTTLPFGPGEAGTLAIGVDRLVILSPGGAQTLPLPPR
jgi:hypothetical protein